MISPRNRKCFIVSWVCLAIWLSGCAGTQVRPPSEWQCDPRSDAAVADGKWEAALSGHETLVLKDPGNCLAIYHLGYIWGRSGSRTKEIEHYRKAISCGYTEDAQLYFNLGMALGDIGDMDSAQAAFERAIALDPENPDHYFGQGLIAQTAGHEPLAEKALEKAVVLAPAHWEARLILAQIYLDQSRWTEARRQLEAVLKGEPGHPEALDLWQTLVTRQRELYFNH